MEHADLVAEMAHVEHMSTQERLHLARFRRLQQLKLWSQREKEWMRHRGSNRESNTKSIKRNIYFSDSVMLLEAAARNDIDEVRRLLMKGVSPDSTNEDGLTALHQCCIDDNEEMMKLLLEYGANVNAEDSEKWTPLHAAATCGHLHLVRYLINRGANLLAVNADGNMPYDICEDEAALDYIEGEMAKRGVTQELIDDTRAATEMQMLHDLQQAVSLRQNIEAPDHQGATPLHIAAANGYLRVVEYLLDQNVSTDVRDSDDWQPVHAAACWGHLEVLELLVHNGADLNAKTKHDETPADICEDPELRERIIQLRSEQETKRMQEAKNRRVKRSQSNTRTQSVRRTSIRDKTLTTKKDAVEEAKLRQQARDVFPVEDSAAEPIQQTFANGDVTPALDLVDVRRAPEGKDGSDDVVANVEGSDIRGAPSAVEIPAETSYVTEGNGKININVTVTINAGTLADLKKQRAQNRNSSPMESTGTSPLLLSPSSNFIGTAAPVRRFTGLETAGPVFVKLGQWASTRRDMFSDEFCQQMAKLQRKRTPHGWNYTSELLENAFGKNWDNIFVMMDKQPIGSGCCAQVYKAWIKMPKNLTGNYLQNTGGDHDCIPVAVKVIHPNMDILLRRDLAILKAAASFVTWIFPSLKWLSLCDCVSDFTQLMTAQVDMDVEAKNLEKFAANFAGVESVCFPHPIRELTTPYILVETFEQGEPLENFILAHSENKINVLLADVGLNTFFKMVFHDNFTHGDLHPGNILVQMHESSGSRRKLFWNNTPKFPFRLIILDCGIVSSMDDKGKKCLRDVFSAIVVGDGRRVAELFLDNSTHQCTNKELFKEKMQNIVQGALARKVNLAQIQVSELLTSLFSTMIEHKVKLDASYSSVLLAIMVLEGLGRSLDPTVDIVEKAKPFLLNTMKV